MTEKQPREPIYYIIADDPSGMFRYRCAIGHSLEAAERSLNSGGSTDLGRTHQYVMTKIAGELSVRKMARKKRRNEKRKPYRKTGVLK